MIDRGPLYGRLRIEALRVVHPQALAEAIAWVADAGLQDDPDVTHGIAGFVENYLGAVAGQLEQEWDGSIGDDEARAIAVFGAELVALATVERPADVAVH